ncbi:hypothetical protein [Oceanicola sp. 502str15]|uniref:hypothetical protein n=1 Tax=Oceanicola sp. 502str15 TaxID=2696061 RepID=UPI002095CB91|nr:hypothetical protein [Oceanicola sp. 502str15]MCO6384038.1 hypothetical protein [Oceanicola sp. 502str15]
MIRLIVLLLVPLVLAACGGAAPVWAPDDEVARARYRHDGPPSLTLMTMINNDSGAGGHTALVVNGSQRVIFDPAGSFSSPAVPERNDVVIGVNPRVMAFYIDYHARPEWRVVTQEVRVSPEVAQRALALVQNNGAVAKAHCAKTTSALLRQIPGFGHVRQTWYPLQVMEDFARIPGVKTEEFRDPVEEEQGYVDPNREFYR